LSFALAPKELLQRRVVVQQLAIGEVQVKRLPEMPAKPASTTPPGSFDLPQLPVAVRLDRLHVGRIRLAPPVAGEAVELAADGDARLAGDAAAARITLRRTDGNGAAELVLALDGTPPRLTASLAVSEPSGAVLGQVLGRDDRPPLAVTLEGAG